MTIFVVGAVLFVIGSGMFAWALARAAARPTPTIPRTHQTVTISPIFETPPTCIVSGMQLGPQNGRIVTLTTCARCHTVYEGEAPPSCAEGGRCTPATITIRQGDVASEAKNRLTLRKRDPS